MEYDYSMMYDANARASELTQMVTRYSLIFSTIFGIIAIIIMWRIFKKAGKEGWIAIVPFYNTYTLFEITWGNGWLFLLIFLAIIPVVGALALGVIGIITTCKLGKAFGKSTGFILGLIFLAPIFYAILAFDKSQYLGVPKKNVTYEQPKSTNPTETSFQPAAFCTGCGTKLAPENTVCPNCGKPRS